MAIPKSRNTFINLSVLLFLFLLISAKQDPELKQCKDECRSVQQHFGEEQREECEKKCELYYKQKQEKERGGSYGDSRERESESEERESENPYVFEERHFSSRFRSEQGRISVLHKFTERSKLLKGIQNYRVELLEANPSTFLLPKHVDAQALYVVLKGRGTITQIRENKRDSFNVRGGDIIKIEAGTPIYMINRDDHEKLFVAKLLRPEATPGQYEVFFGAGGENPKSYYKIFNPDLLEAALKTKKEKIEKVFGQQRQGVIIKASKEQIRALSQKEEGGGIWPFGGETRSGGPYNLFHKRPTHSNQHGRLHIVDASDFEDLQDLNLEVAFANISRGSMIGPSFMSKATKIAFVMDGEGYFEMACPHLSSQRQAKGRQEEGSRGSEKSQGASYHKVSAPLRRGTLFIVPAGHPVAVVASQDRNLQIVCFDVNALNNKLYPLAGKNNVINLFEKEAKELAFGVASKEVDEVFGNQDEDLFFPGPRQEQGGRAYA